MHISTLEGLKPLLRIEDWEIYAYNEMDNASGVHAYHIDCKGKVIKLHWERWEPQTCYNCHAPVPKGIVALVLLHDWGKERR